MARSSILQVFDFVAQTSRDLELEVLGGRHHLGGRLLDKYGELGLGALARCRRRPPRSRRYAPALLPCDIRPSRRVCVSTCSRASMSVTSEIFLRSGCGSMPCSLFRRSESRDDASSRDGLVHGIRHVIRVHVDLTGHVSGGAADRLDERAGGAQEAFLIRVRIDEGTSGGSGPHAAG